MRPANVSGVTRVLGRPVAVGLAAIIAAPTISNFPLANLGYWATTIALFDGFLGVTPNSTTASAWADMTANAHNLSQGTAANQPTIIAKGLTGWQTVRGDGVNDLMSTGAFTVAQPLHYFMVMKMVTVQASPNNVVWTTKAAGTGTLYVDSTPLSRVNYASALDYAGIVANTVFARVEVSANGGSSSLVENETTRSSGAAGANGIDFITLFNLPAGGQPANVEYAIWVAFSSTLAGATLRYVRAWQRNHFGIA